MAGVYTVTQINSYIKNMFRQDFVLNRIQIKGEISNCKYHTSGHVYFTLKDSGGTIAVVMFASYASKLDTRLCDGMSVVVNGRIDVYERDGKYQLYAEKVTESGIGDLYKQYELLKNQYEEMGYFAQEYKRPIPRFSKRIGIVTASTGAAIRDIMNISNRRNPYAQLYLYPALVQGEYAKYSIVKGIKKLEAMDLDCIIVGRGGGSLEDLWAFNEPEVIEAVFACKTPVISAVGHETDFTLTDFVSDLRAPTPSAAAELAVCDITLVENSIANYQKRFTQIIKDITYSYRNEVNNMADKLRLLNPSVIIQERRQQLMHMEERLERLMQDNINQARHRLGLASTRLEGVSPLKKLNQGYGYIENDKSQHITSVEGISKDDKLNIYLKDGVIKTKVINVDIHKSTEMED